MHGHGAGSQVDVWGAGGERRQGTTARALRGVWGLQQARALTRGVEGGGHCPGKALRRCSAPAALPPPAGPPGWARHRKHPCSLECAGQWCLQRSSSTRAVGRRKGGALSRGPAASIYALALPPACRRAGCRPFPRAAHAPPVTHLVLVMVRPAGAGAGWAAALPAHERAMLPACVSADAAEEIGAHAMQW